MERIIFRCPPELLAEIKRRAKAAGVSPGLLTRQLWEKETGIVGPEKYAPGLANADKKTKKRVQAARWGRQ